MAKVKTLEINEEGILQQQPAVEIKSAKIKDLFCNYSYELLSGITEGDVLDRKGSSIIHDDLKNAFKRLNVHLAVICEQVSIAQLGDIEEFENIDLSQEFEPGSLMEEISNFHCTGFSLEGNAANLVLFGTRILSTGDTLKLTTPKTEWEGSYPYLGELRCCVDDAIREVEAYMNGKAAPKYEQKEIDFGEEEFDEE